MAPRANWKGYLKLSLVSCPVALFPATSSNERVSFHLLNRDTGDRLKQQYVDSVSGEIVETEDRMRGYEIAKGDYVPVEDDELQNVQLESTHTIDIETFVPRKDIDELYLDKPYYLVPDDKVGEEAFGVIRDAMRKRGVAGLARVVLYGREHILLLEPRDKGLLATTLHYDYEVREGSTLFDEIGDVKMTDEMLDLASHIIDTKKGKFEPSKFKDRYQDALVELIRAKRAGRPPPKAPSDPGGGNVINLMDALRKSISGGGAAGKATGKSTAKAPKRSSSKAAPAKATAPERRAKTTGRKSAARDKRAGRTRRRTG